MAGKGGEVNRGDGMQSRLRDKLKRLHRRTVGYSKSITMLRASLALVRLRLELSKYQKMGSRVTSLGVFTISKHTISVANL